MGRPSIVVVGSGVREEWDGHWTAEQGPYQDMERKWLSGHSCTCTHKLCLDAVVKVGVQGFSECLLVLQSCMKLCILAEGIIIIVAPPYRTHTDPDCMSVCTHPQTLTRPSLCSPSLISAHYSVAFFAYPDVSLLWSPDGECLLFVYFLSMSWCFPPSAVFRWCVPLSRTAPLLT